jgi:flagellum-specific peptidoglycan hydrolase FlgJ
LQCWQDIRTKTKSKCAAVRKHSGGTGGGPPSAESLTELDEHVLDMICTTSVDGHKESSESIVLFDFQDEKKANSENSNESEQQEEAETAPEKMIHKNNNQVRRKPIQRRLTACDVMAETSKKKLAIKENYYKEKLKILKERNDILRTLVTAIKEKKCSFCSSEELLLNKI